MNVIDVLHYIRGSKVPNTSFPAGASERKIRSAFSQNSRFIPRELYDLYTFSDGLSIGDFTIAPLDQALWLESDCMTIHAWGNGDIDTV